MGVVGSDSSFMAAYEVNCCSVTATVTWPLVELATAVPTLSSSWPAACVEIGIGEPGGVGAPMPRLGPQAMAARPNITIAVSKPCHLVRVYTDYLHWLL